MSEVYLLGLDVGTSGVKALLLPVEGRDEHPNSTTVDLLLSTPRPGWTEQNPDDWWAATAEAIGRVLTEGGVDPAQIAGIAASGQMHGATLLDRTGAVVRPCILWNDQRTAAECAHITNSIGVESLLANVGNPALTGFTLPKLLWVRAHEPEAYERIATVLLPKDYINFRLTGELATEASDASGTLLFDVARRRWSDTVAGGLDISTSLLPLVHRSIDVVGEVTHEAARLTGLRAGTPVIAGGADNACAAVGMGVVRPGQVLASLGTSGTLVAPMEQPEVDPQGRLHTFCHAVPDTWYAMGVVLSAGGSLRWVRDALGEPERETARRQGRDPYEVIMDGAAEVPAGSEGLLFLPYLTGERTPHADPNARGVLFGLSLRHDRRSIARSVVEGVTYALADSADLMRQLGVDVETVRVTGGGARSKLWRSILADVLGARVVWAGGDTGPAFGAAILAGVGADVFSSVEEATERLVGLAGAVEPDPETSTLYAQYRTLYDHLYPALKAEYSALAELVETTSVQPSE